MAKIDFKILTPQVIEYANQHLKHERYEHSIRVAEYAAHLAELYQKNANNNLTIEIAYFTGVAHDICKHETDDTLINLIKEDGIGIDEIEKTRLNLLHGRAAAVVLKNNFGITENSILDAVAFHTFGYENIDTLGKIIYIADKIEPKRPNTENFRSFAETGTLNQLMLKIIDWQTSHVIKKGGEIHPLTKKMYNKIKEESNNNEN